jgi:hypothetical protein
LARRGDLAIAGRVEKGRPPWIALAALAGALAAGCGNPLPGTLLGTYTVTATAGANACGLAAPAVYQFDVELSETAAPKATLYWSWLANQPIASGPLAPVSSDDPSLQATLTSSQSLDVDATDAGPGPCTMVRDDTLVVVLGAGAPPGSFTGTMGYAFSAASGADCSDQLAAEGGSYAALPCSVTYSLRAHR